MSDDASLVARLFKPLLEELGVRRVVARREEVQRDTLYVGVTPVMRGVRGRRRAVFVRGFNDLNPVDVNPDNFDVIVYRGRRGWTLPALLAYNEELNVYVTAGFSTLPYTQYRALLRLAVLVKRGGEPPRLIDPLFEVRELITNWPVYIALVKLDTRRCKEANVDVVVGEHGATIVVPVECESTIVTVDGAPYRLPRPVKTRAVVEVKYDGDGRLRGVEGRGVVVFDGREYPHPNISASWEVCTGSYKLPRLGFGEELCSQAARIAEKLREVLCTPELASAYNNDLLEALDKADVRLRRLDWG